MKRKQQIIPMLLITGIIYPQVTLAAWWNPLSWFQSNTTEKIEIIEDFSDLENLDNVESKSLNSNAQNISSGRIVERIITVKDPELQKQINNLLQENLDLQKRILALTSELNSCKAPVNVVSKSDDNYSDYVFKYRVDENSITLLGATSRDLKIRKAVFNLHSSYSETFKERFNKSDTKGTLEIAERTYKLERTNDTTYSYLGSGISIVGSEDVVIRVVDNGGVSYRMVPDWSLWEIWDYTVGKKVRIE